MTNEEQLKRIVKVTKDLQSNLKAKLVSVVFIDENNLVLSGTESDSSILSGDKLLEFVGHLELMKVRLVEGIRCNIKTNQLKTTEVH